MKTFIRCFALVFLSATLFCVQSFAAPTIGGFVGIYEWGSDDYNQTTTTGEGINPTPDTRGNLHVENGGSSPESTWAYDAEKLGLIIENDTLYIALQTDYDFTNESQDYKPGDFIFQFADVEGTEAINENSSLALDFDFNDSNELTNLTFYWGDLEFKGSTDFQEGLASYVTEFKNSDSDFAYNAIYKYNDGRNALDNGHTLELSIDLASLDLDTQIRNLFAESDYAQMHWQMSCGNDILYVADTYSPPAHAPEPATFFLLGIGLLGAGFLERRHQEQKKG